VLAWRLKMMKTKVSRSESAKGGLKALTGKAGLELIGTEGMDRFGWIVWVSGCIKGGQGPLYRQVQWDEQAEGEEGARENTGCIAISDLMDLGGH